MVRSRRLANPREGSSSSVLNFRRLLLLPFLECLCLASATGQILIAHGPTPSFEVASIKPWKASPRPIAAAPPTKIDPGQRVRVLETDRVHFIGQINLFVMDAYNLPLGSEKRILNAPAWANSEADRYEITAKIDASMFAAMQKMTPEQQREQVQLLEQSLLAERFHLRVHSETRGETSVYGLVVDRGGPKLTSSKPGEESMLTSLRNQITAQAVTLDQFARSPLWTPIGDRYVVNQTGLTGTYDFTLKWRSDDLEKAEAIESERDLPFLFDAIREQLGLKVIDSKAPREVFVIDNIQRHPGTSHCTDTSAESPSNGSVYLHCRIQHDMTNPPPAPRHALPRAWHHRRAGLRHRMGGFHLGKKFQTPEDSVQLTRGRIDAGITFLDNSWDHNEGTLRDPHGQSPQRRLPREGLPHDQDRRPHRRVLRQAAQAIARAPRRPHHRPRPVPRDPPHGRPRSHLGKGGAMEAAIKARDEARSATSASPATKTPPSICACSRSPTGTGSTSTPCRCL